MISRGICSLWCRLSTGGVIQLHCAAEIARQAKQHDLLGYRNVAFDALWRLTTETHEQWIHGSDYLAALLEVPGLCKVRCVPDWMHQGHLGVLPLFEGGVILDSG